MNTTNIIVASPNWCLSGVNVFAANLVRGLQAAGIRAWILLTDTDEYKSLFMTLPTDISIERLPIDYRVGWRLRWPVMIRYLEEHAPCIYLPNYDFGFSSVSPRLSVRIGVVGIVHANDPLYYESIARLGRYMNAVVTVSRTLAEHMAILDPTLVPRLSAIPYGVEVPPRLPKRPVSQEAPLRVVYAGRLVQHEKRVLDLPRIVTALAERQVPVELTIIGSGMEQQQLIDACAPFLIEGKVRFMGMLPNEYVHRVFDQSDVVIMMSETEGMPVSLLEAMGRGCVPVVTDIRSGMAEVVREGVNGFLVPVGDIQAFAERLALLQRDLALRQEMASQAYHTICTGGYRVEDMVQKYIALFGRVLRDIESGDYCRPKGSILPPPTLRDMASWKNVLLSASVQSVSRAFKNLLRNRILRAKL